MKHAHSNVRPYLQPWYYSILVAWMSLFALGLVDNARGPVFPDVLKDFALTDTVGSFFFLAASLASLIHNTVFYRFLCETNPKRLIGIYTLIMAAGALLISYTTDFRATLVACAILGIGFGGLGVGQNAAVQAAPSEHRQRAMGILHAMYGLSSFSAPLLVAYLASYGWRLALVLLSLPSVFVGLLVVFESARKKNRTTISPVENSQDALAERVSGESAAGENHVSLLTQAKERRAAWYAAALVALLVVAEISVSSRLTLLARRDWGISIESAGSWLAAYFAAMTLSRLVLGLVRFPFSARQLLWFAIFLGAPFLIVGFLPLGFSREIRLLSLVGFGFPIAMGYPLAMTRLAEIFGPRVQRVTSLCLILQSGAAMTMHFVLGWGADSHGLLFVLGTVSFAALLGISVSFWRLEKVVAG